MNTKTEPTTIIRIYLSDPTETVWIYREEKNSSEA